MKIRRAAVLGAGVMGAQIAAHLAAVKGKNIFIRSTIRRLLLIRS